MNSINDIVDFVILILSQSLQQGWQWAENVYGTCFLMNGCIFQSYSRLEEGRYH